MGVWFFGARYPVHSKSDIAAVLYLRAQMVRLVTEGVR
jgi:hypothetical protein